MVQTQRPIHPIPAMEVWKDLPEGLHAEVIDKKLYVSPSPSTYHQRVLGSLTRAIEDHVMAFGLGEVWYSPVDVFLEGYEKGVVIPDIIFISKNNPTTVERRGLFGAPDLLIEILSPGRKKYDFTIKKNLYERTGVKEYWLVDPETKGTTGYKLEEGAYGNPLLLNSKIHVGIFDKTFQF